MKKRNKERVSASRYLSQIEAGLQNTSDDDSVRLKGTALKECKCPNTGAHNRFHRNNTRSKIEGMIISYVTSHFSNKPINILSLGSGGFLQDFLLLLKLIKAGIRSVHLTMIEPEANDVAYTDLITQLELLKENFSDLNLTYEKYDTINAIVDRNVKYDVMYAIDYEDYLSLNDYSKRQLPGREGKFRNKKENYKEKNSIFSSCKPKENFEPDPYLATVDLIKADNLLNKDGRVPPLSIVSHGKDIISLSLTAKSSVKEYPLLSKLIPNVDEVSAFYVNANIVHLVNNILYFIQAKKPLLLNKNIIQAEDRQSVEAFLNKNDISYEFVDENNMDQLKKYQASGLIAVVDYTVFDKVKSELAIEKELNQKNIFVARLDWVKSRGKTLSSSMELFPPFKKARRLVLTDPTGVEFETMFKLNKEMMDIVSEIKDTKNKKDQYLSLLKGKISELDDDEKKLFAAYLLNSPNHLLKRERDFFRRKAYSVQTRSFHKAMSILLGDEMEVVSRKILINDYTLTRHANSCNFKNKASNRFSRFRRY